MMIFSDAIFVVVANSLTSLIAACTIFMFLGHVKVALNKDILDFVRSGPQMVFEVMVGKLSEFFSILILFVLFKA